MGLCKYTKYCLFVWHSDVAFCICLGKPIDLWQMNWSFYICLNFVDVNNYWRFDNCQRQRFAYEIVMLVSRFDDDDGGGGTLANCLA